MIHLSTLAIVAALGGGQAAAAPAAAYPLRIPAPGGEVVITSEGERRAYDAYRYAPARRVGDTLYISGMIVGPGPGEKRDVEAFKAQSRRTFQRLKRTLEASGSSFADVVMINSFHVWQGPGFEGGRDDQFAAFQEVMDEFMDPPWPAWTAVGTSGLLADDGVVEIQVIARAPKSP